MKKENNQTKIMQISRSFARKINLGNYEVVDLFASYSLEIPADTSDEEQKRISKELFEKAKADVLEEKKEIMEQLEARRNGERTDKIQQAKELIKS